MTWHEASFVGSGAKYVSPTSIGAIVSELVENSIAGKNTDFVGRLCFEILDYIAVWNSGLLLLSCLAVVFLSGRGLAGFDATLTGVIVFACGTRVVSICFRLMRVCRSL